MRKRIRQLLDRYNNQSITQKISFLFVLLFGLVFAVSSTALYMFKRGETIGVIEQGSARNSMQVSDYLTGTITLLVEEMLLLNERMVDNGHRTVYGNNPASQEERMIALNKYVNGINMLNNNFQYIHSIFIINAGNQLYMYRASNWELNPSIFPADADVLRQLQMETTKTRWTGIIPASTYFSGSSASVISFITPFFPSGGGNNIVLLNLSVSGLSDYLKKQLGENDTGILLDCGNGDYITTGGEIDALVEKSAFQSALAGLEGNSGILRHRQYVLAFQQMKPTGWKVITVTDLHKGSGSIYGYLAALIIAVVGLFSVLTVVAFTVVRMITRPLRKLSSIMEGVAAGGNLGTRFQAKYEDEIGTLARGYNEMMDRIVALTRQVVQNEKEKRDAKIRLMQMQIKPHFLYNALETARFMTEMDDPRSTEMISSIAKFYQLTLSGVSDQTSIKEEVEQLEHYLRIQSVRYSSVFTYALDIPPEILPFQIIKFTLQPLVENAIYHGLKCKIEDGKGILRVSAVFDGEDIVFQVYDNGVGMSPEQLSRLRERIQQKDALPSQHIGVYNVNRRLILSYGEEYGLTVDSQAGGFTCFTVRIPQVKRGEAHV